MDVVVIGIGQRMRGDDGAGLEALRLWQRVHVKTAGRSEVRVGIVEAPSLELLSLLEGADAAILVDAVCSGAAAGTVHQVGMDKVASMRSACMSVHGWGVAEVLQMASTLDPASRQRQISIVGIEAASVEYGAGLSKAVQDALPAACAAIQGAVSALLAA